MLNCDCEFLDLVPSEATHYSEYIPFRSACLFYADQGQISITLEMYYRYGKYTNRFPSAQLNARHS